MSEKAYLTEEMLGRFLRERLDAGIIANRTIPGLKRRFRPDYRSELRQLIVEFDGFQHYTTASHVIEDQQRDAIIENAGYRIIRIPYFVQLDRYVINLLFGEMVSSCNPFNDYPHGFIDEKVVFPADFCELGLQRFQEDLNRFSAIRLDIERSLTAAVESGKDWRRIYPPSLYRPQ